MIIKWARLHLLYVLCECYIYLRDAGSIEPHVDENLRRNLNHTVENIVQLLLHMYTANKQVFFCLFDHTHKELATLY